MHFKGKRIIIENEHESSHLLEIKNKEFKIKIIMYGNSFREFPFIAILDYVSRCDTMYRIIVNKTQVYKHADFCMVSRWKASLDIRLLNAKSSLA